MAQTPPIIHGFGLRSSAMPKGTSTEAGVSGSVGVTLPFLNYKVPTAVALGIALFILFALHMLGARFGVVLGAGINAR